MQTKIDICNAALVMIGAEAISDFGDGSRQASICEMMYDNIYRDILQSNLWRFSLKKSLKLNKLTVNPEVRFNDYNLKNAFELPSDFLRLGGLENPAGYPFLIMGSNLLCNAEEVQIIYQGIIEEKNLPEYFKRLLVLEFCELFCVSLLENEQKAGYYNQLKERQAAKARMIDSKNQVSPAIPLQEFSIITVRT